MSTSIDPTSTDPTSTEVTITRADLVRYAGASGDFNPIHWSDAAATAIGMPGVIAHGMFTLALAVKQVTDRVGDPARVVSVRTRFTKPVVVPAEGGATVSFSTSLSAGDEVDEVVVEAVCDGVKVLGNTRVGVRHG